jgi:hypothetical protein
METAASVFAEVANACAGGGARHVGTVAWTNTASLDSPIESDVGGRDGQKNVNQIRRNAVK